MGARSSSAASPLGTWLGRLPWPRLAAGWVLAFAVGTAFGLIVKLAGWWPDGAAWERSLLVAAHETVSPALDLIMLRVPLIGTNYSMAPLVAIAVVWLWLRKSRLAALQLAIVQAGSWTLNPALKFTLPRPRPDLFELRGQYALPAYPSGHSIAIVSVVFTAAYLIHRAGHGRWAYGAAAAFFLLNSYSRIYLSVHWPTDVIGGTIVGAIWLGITLAAFRRLRG